MFDGRTQWSHAPVLSSAYPVRPGEDNCLFYMKNHLCEWGSECCYNHPPLQVRKKTLSQLIWLSIICSFPHFLYLCYYKQEIPCRIGKKLDCKVHFLDVLLLSQNLINSIGCCGMSGL